MDHELRKPPALEAPNLTGAGVVNGNAPGGQDTSSWPVAALAFLGTLVGFVVSAVVMWGAPTNVFMQTLWPALGIAVGIAVRWRRRSVLPAVALGVVFGTIGVLLAAGWQLRDVAAVAIVITVDLLGLTLLLGLLSVCRLKHPWEVVNLSWATVAMAAATAIPALVVSRRWATEGTEGWADPVSWLSGCAWGVLLFTPVVLTATRPTTRSWRRAPEFALATGLTLSGTFLLFSTGTPGGAALLGVRYLVIFGVTWLAVRFGAAAVAPVLAVVAVYGAAPFTAKGVFTGGASDLLAQVRLVQSSALVIGVTMLLLAVLIDERRRAFAEVEGVAQERREQASRLAVLFQQSPTPAARLLVGESGEIQVLESSLAMRRLLGPPQAGDTRTTLGLGVLPEDREAAWSVVSGALQRAESPSGGMRPQSEVRLLTADGGVVTVLMSAAAVPSETGDDRANEVVVHAVDITARREAEQALTKHALTDAVTGLPNRHSLQDRLAMALHHLGREPGLVGVFFCDLDQFKQVNDTLGHQAGDVLLQEIAARLTTAVRSSDTVARLGGDEFVVLCDGLHDADELESFAHRLKDGLRGPWVYDERVFHPTMSVGVAFTGDPTMSVHELLRRADVAMYRAKYAGRDRVEVYQRSADDELGRAVAMQQRVRACLDSNGFVLHYQPVVDLRDGRFVGAEALIRMPTARGRLILPDEFVPDAEANGLIAPVGEWVLRRAFADLREWRRRGNAYQLSVNVSARQLVGGGFSRWLLEEAEKSDLDPVWIRVEVTDNVLMEHGGDVRSRELVPLQRAGVAIALDRFGAGFFHLGWLREFPIDIVKIDRSFTRQLGTEPRSTTITAALLLAAGDLGVTVTAAGVETAQQRDMLTEMGCPEAQGFLLGRPVPANDPVWG